MGDKGDPGPKGDQGLSAYEVWLAAGNVGTEQNFLDSLISTVPGQKGDIGEQGQKGDTGDVGPQGPIGPTGATGPAGTTDYNLLLNTPTIPTALSQLADDSTHRLVTDTQLTKLAGIADGAEVNVNADWNAVSGDAQILNKPTAFTPTSHGNEAHTTAYATEAVASLNTKSLNEIGSTGLVSGCDLTINSGNPATFDMSAGVGVIFDNYTDPANPTRTVVSIPARTGLSPDYLLTDATSYVFANAAGNIVYNNYGSTAEDRRELISIGWVDHPDNTEITALKVQPFSNTSVAAQLNDFFLSFGPFNVSGNTYAPAGGLTIARSAGETFDSNANYAEDRQNPHIIKTNLESPCEIYYYHRNGTGDWVNDAAPVSNLSPNFYDDGSGTLAAVPAGKWTIQIVSFYAQTLTTDVQYGQAVYGTYAAAKTALQDAVDINPYNSYDTFRGWIIVKQGATDLTDIAQAEFVAAGKFGLVDVASGGGVGGEVNTASNLGTGGIGLYHQKIGVDLQFKNIDASGVLSLTDNTTTHVVSVVHADDTNTRHVTDAEKAAWNAKQAALGFTPVPNTRTIAGKALSADITLLKSDVGLGNVDNTSDANKPVSDPQQLALDAKAPSIHSHVISDVEGLQTALDGKIAEAPVDNKQYARKNGTWAEVVSSGGSGQQEVFVQSTQPAATGQPYIWIQTGLPDNGFTFWFEDGL